MRAEGYGWKPRWGAGLKGNGKLENELPIPGEDTGYKEAIAIRALACLDSLIPLPTYRTYRCKENSTQENNARRFRNRRQNLAGVKV